MRLGEKLRYLREVEGTLRGMDRELSQVELARLIQKELGKSISQSYLSQIESGARPHLTDRRLHSTAELYRPTQPLAERRYEIISRGGAARRRNSGRR